MKQLQISIEQLFGISKNINDAVLTNEIKALYDKVLERNFYVVVVGLFKRGKSSLINALIGANLSPVAITPLTAIITILKYGDTPYAEVKFTNGFEEKIDLEQIHDFVSEEENPHNTKQVAIVTIYYNASLLQNISLVDTPGLGSAYKHNTETTLQFIPKIDAALLVLSADTPVSKTDIDFLKQMHASVHKFLFVLNKSDLLSFEDLAKITSYNKEVIANALGQNKHDITITPVSCKNESGVDILRYKLHSLIENEKDGLLIKSTERQLNQLKQKAIALLQLQIDSLLMPVNILSERLLQFKKSKKLMEESSSEFEIIVNNKVKKLDALVHTTISHEAKQLEADIRREIEQSYSGRLLNQEEKTHLQTKLNQLVLSRFDEAKNEMEAEAKEHFVNLLHEHGNRSQGFLNELIKQLSSLMNINFEMVSDKFDLDVYTSFYLTVKGTDGNITNGKEWYFPFTGNEQKIRREIKKFHQHYYEIIVFNTASVIYDLQYKMQESLRKFNRDLNLHFNELLSSMKHIIENTLQQKADSSFKVTDEVERLQQLISEIKLI